MQLKEKVDYLFIHRYITILCSLHIPDIKKSEDASRELPFQNNINFKNLICGTKSEIHIFFYEKTFSILFSCFIDK